LAEFALVMPVLLMILFGIIEFGFAFRRSQSLEAAAREGGRLASLSSTSAAEVADRVDDVLGTTSFDGPPVGSVEPSGGCVGREGLTVTVTVTAPHRLTIPFAIDRDLNLTGRSVFRCEA
jgi:Flp pilus assembly protein TadG